MPAIPSEEQHERHESSQTQMLKDQLVIGAGAVAFDVRNQPLALVASLQVLPVLLKNRERNPILTNPERTIVLGKSSWLCSSPHHSFKCSSSKLFNRGQSLWGWL
ncbi:hypothetical protein FRC14_002920 [Serendipita sp. 396]|nr:hypothetical protein FRC14_002920 [Serendipita sp. 396]